MKIIATIIPTDLATNSLLASFNPFLQTKNRFLEQEWSFTHYFTEGAEGWTNFSKLEKHFI